MAVSTKGKRKVRVKGKQYIWSVDERPGTVVPDEGFVATTAPRRCLHIISSDKKFIIHYYLPQPGDRSAHLEVVGPEFPRQPGAASVEVPRWHHDTKLYPTADFVRRLIGWCLGLE